MSQFKTTLKNSDFQEGTLMKKEVGGKSIVIGMVDDRLHAMDWVCSHEGGPLEEGWLEELSLTCPWHQGVLISATLRHRRQQVGLLRLEVICSYS